MKIALMADVHGNLPALEAVINELERLQPDYVILNGDLINAVPFSTQVIDRVMALDWLVTRGNHEFYYLDWGTERAGSGTEDPERWGQLHWLVRQVSPEQGGYLATLPDERTLYLPGTQPLRVAHGVPGANRVGFYNHQPEEKIAIEIDHVRERTLLSAHTHVQIDRQIQVAADYSSVLHSDPHVDIHNVDSHTVDIHGRHRPAVRRWHLVNPGSVGLPLNRDVRTQFAMLEAVPDDVVWGGWRVSHHRVEYDRRPALAAYEESGMLEAGGVISQLFYWELVTADAELIYFYQWARKTGHDPDGDVRSTFQAYINSTGRDQFVRDRDPLFVRGAL